MIRVALVFNHGIVSESQNESEPELVTLCMLIN